MQKYKHMKLITIISGNVLPLAVDRLWEYSLLVSIIIIEN